MPKVLVLGGTGAVGSASCRCLAREKAVIGFTYHSKVEAASALAREIGSSLFLPCDLANAEDVEKTVQLAITKLGGLDALVVAAGVPAEKIFHKPGSEHDRMGEISWADYDQVQSVNTRGVFAACRAGAHFLAENGGGNVVVLGSMDGIKNVPSPVHFAVSKAALLGLVGSLSKELGARGVKVNLIAPGVLESGASTRLPEDKRKTYLKHCSLGRFGKPSEVAEWVSWLCLENTYLTGQSILLDGGL